MDVVERVALHPSEVERSDKKTDHYRIKGTAGIKEEEENWAMKLVERLLDCFSHMEVSCK